MYQYQMGYKNKQKTKTLIKSQISIIAAHLHEINNCKMSIFSSVGMAPAKWFTDLRNHYLKELKKLAVLYKYDCLRKKKVNFLNHWIKRWERIKLKKIKLKINRIGIQKDKIHQICSLLSQNKTHCLINSDQIEQAYVKLFLSHQANIDTFHQCAVPQSEKYFELKGKEFKLRKKLFELPFKIVFQHSFNEEYIRKSLQLNNELSKVLKELNE
jgi:hypothetical protein